MAKNFKYGDVLKDREYRKLLFSNLINRFGDSIDAIAFSWLAYEITHSASWAALIFGLNVLPNIIVQPLVGPIVEKLDKKRVIVFTHLARAIVITAFALMYMVGVLSPYILAAFTLVTTTIESFNLPASGAFIPLVIKKEKLAHAMSLNSSLSSAVVLVGTGVAGVIIAKFGVQTAMLIDVVTFFAAAIGILSIKTSEKPETVTVSEAPETKAHKESYLAMLKDGFKYVAGNRVIINFGIMAIFMNFLLVPLNSLEAPLAAEVFGLGSALLSVMGMTASFGGIVGSAITPVIMEKFSSKRIVITCGIVMGAFMYVLSLGRLLGGAALPGYILVGTCYFMMAFAASIIGGTVNIQFVKFCDEQYLARAGAVMGATSSASVPVGSLIVSAAAIHLSPAALIGGCGILAIVFIIIIGICNLDFELVKEEKVDAAIAIGQN
jgi:MFS family permease